MKRIEVMCQELHKAMFTYGLYKKEPVVAISEADMLLKRKPTLHRNGPPKQTFFQLCQQLGQALHDIGKPSQTLGR